MGGSAEILDLPNDFHSPMSRKEKIFAFAEKYHSATTLAVSAAVTSLFEPSRAVFSVALAITTAEAFLLPSIMYLCGRPPTPGNDLSSFYTKNKTKTIASRPGRYLLATAAMFGGSYILHTAVPNPLDDIESAMAASIMDGSYNTRGTPLNVNGSPYTIRTGQIVQESNGVTVVGSAHYNRPSFFSDNRMVDDSIDVHAFVKQPSDAFLKQMKNSRHLVYVP